VPGVSRTFCHLALQNQPPSGDSKPSRPQLGGRRLLTRRDGVDSFAVFFLFRVLSFRVLSLPGNGCCNLSSWRMFSVTGIFWPYRRMWPEQYGWHSSWGRQDLVGDSRLSQEGDSCGRGARAADWLNRIGRTVSGARQSPFRFFTKQKPRYFRHSCNSRQNCLAAVLNYLWHRRHVEGWRPAGAGSHVYSPGSSPGFFKRNQQTPTPIIRPMNRSRTAFPVGPSEGLSKA
jgi:hypothetical protein